MMRHSVVIEFVTTVYRLASRKSANLLRYKTSARKGEMVQLKYFGDSRDYFKYDLISSIFEAKIVERYVYLPMLTEHRSDNEGRKAPRYNGDKSSDLYEFIKACETKSLRHWETWLGNYAASYKTVEPVDETYFHDESRVDYWGQFKNFMNSGATLVFVDPDTGLETETASYRRKMGSEKYLLNNELSLLFSWLNPASILMIYQHLPHDKSEHASSTQKKLLQIQSVCKNSFTFAYREDDLAFLFVTKSNAIFQRLFLCLSKYHDKSVHNYKAIARLHNQVYSSACERTLLNPTIAKIKENKTPINRNVDGVIINAEDLTLSDVVQERVLCPGCHEKVFEKWPFGWDAHVASRCRGAEGSTEEERKTYFKERFAHLFKA